jgi:dTDP-4-dehydrorhamnose reductase
MYLIVGGDSTIGRALSTFWNNNGVHHFTTTRKLETVAVHRPFVDLASKNWSHLEGLHFSAVVFCAASTNLSTCENYPQDTARINVEGTTKLASYLSDRATYLLLLSSNQVFDGSKPSWKVTDHVCPVNEYGRQKAEAERLILQMQRSAVLRLTKVVHPDMHLLKQWQESLQSGKPIEAFADLNISPISLKDVVTQIDDLVQNQKTGIHHLSGKLDISYFSFAKNYFKNIPNVEFLIKKTYIKDSKFLAIASNSHTTLG